MAFLLSRTTTSTTRHGRRATGRGGRTATSSSTSYETTSYPTLIYFNKADKGGHFAAWEEPELFATELRAAFKSLR
jgi:hypothetical protein